MAAQLLVQSETEPGVSGGNLKPVEGRPGSFIEKWLNNNLTGIALVVVAAGLGSRLWAASGRYLNPDEALHYMVINQPSAFLAYKASLQEAHPPLLYLLLYFWHFLGRSELMLRLPSVLAGAAFCWFTFKWMGLFFGRRASLIGVVIATFSPAMINLSAELRQYALLLFCMAAALYFLGRGLQENSSRDIWCFSVFLYLAILSHYSAVFFAITIGVYVIVRIAGSPTPRRLISAWLVGQLGAVAIYGFLYWTQVSKATSNIQYWEIPFSQYYFHWQNGDGDLFFFLKENTSKIIVYLFKQEYVSQAMLGFIIAGVVLLFIRGLVPPRGRPRSCHLGILVTLPFLAAWGASIAGVYPYIGSRHTIFLAPFAIAAASYLLAAVSREKVWPGLAIAVVLMAASFSSEDPATARISNDNQRRTLMVGALDFIHRSVPRNEAILSDLQGSVVLPYYLCGPREMIRFDKSHGDFSDFSCDGYSVLGENSRIWKLHAGNFGSEFKKMVRDHALKPGDRVWVFQTGWGTNLDVELPGYSRQFRCLTPKSFGTNITVIPFVIGPDFSPVTPIKTCGAAG